MLVLGSGGMLGRATLALLGARGVASRHADFPHFDTTDRASVERTIDGSCPLAINCAAYTDVDGAETDPQAAHAVNERGVALLAARCKAVGCTLVHYSTDYVFDGLGVSPYPTSHPRRPLNAYGRSKAAGEEALERSGADHLLARTSWLYAPWGKNFVRTIARIAASKPSLRVVDDQRGRPTSAEHLARLTLAMVEAGARGTHHLTDGGECTWFEFAQAIVRGRGLSAVVEPCTSAEFPRPALRPAYSVLDLSKSEALIGPIQPWQRCLEEVLPRLELPL